MPQIKVEHVVSFSSEDPVHTANNVLSSDPSKKWKCATAGSTSATIVLQLEKASLITGIDIGNEHSAYIEVLVSRSGSNEDFKVLLVMSSFMTPLDARQSQNVNKVRMFKNDDLSDPERDQKWDRVKVVCTQPFNRHVQYGLSFITFHSSEQNVKNATQATIGKFLLRPESPDNLSIGNLFARRKEIQQEEKQEALRGAAAIRVASSAESLAQYGSPKCKPKNIQSVASCSTPKAKKNAVEKNSSPLLRNRDELLYSKDEEEPNEKIDTKIEKKAKEKEQASTSKEGKETKQNSADVTNKRNHKRKRSEEREKNNKKGKQTKPFGTLLSDVTLVISGIQNPDRANLRGMALSMGARYKPDWDNTCTHLICAFANTPKFNQVKGKGKIVTKNWIQDCHSQRKRLPWRRYALDKNDKGTESEEEICEYIKEKTPEKSDTDDDTYSEMKADGSDTEDRIARIQEMQKKNGNKKDVFQLDTDSEEEQSNDKCSLEITKKLPSFFDRKIFHIDLTLDRDLQSKINQYITAYKGTVSDEPTSDNNEAIIIVTTDENADNFKEINQSATCVSPEWVWQCHNSQMLTPMDEFTL